MGNPESSESRFAYLDFLRALACLPVLLSHYIPDLLPSGGIGVGIFFALSGFLISQISRKEIHGISSASKFVIRRIFRVFPLFLFDLFFLYLVYSQQTSSLNFEQFVSSLPGLITMQSMPNSFIGFGVAVFWTLQIEFMFYLLVPVLSLLMGAKKALIYLSAVLVSMTCISIFLEIITEPQTFQNVFLSHPFIRFGGCLGIGVIVSLLWGSFIARTYVLNRFPTYSWPLFVLGVGGFVALLFMPIGKDATWPISIFLASICGAILILVWLLNPSIWVFPGSAFIGRISFSIYLIHALLLDIFISTNFKSFFPSDFLYLGVAIFLVIMFSTLTYYLIEQPGVKLGKHISKYIK